MYLISSKEMAGVMSALSLHLHFDVLPTYLYGKQTEGFPAITAIYLSRQYVREVL